MRSSVFAMIHLIARRLLAAVTRLQVPTVAVAILAVLATLMASPRSAIAMRCTTSILGPNDPDYAPAELAPGTGLTFNAEYWYLFDCIPQSTPKAVDPEGSSGMFFNQAWAKYGFGRSDLIVAYIEGGINWRETETADLRRKAYLNCGELPAPERADGSTLAGNSPGCLEPAKSYDLDGDGVLTPDDYANDPRVARPFIHQATAGGITSEDLIVAFSDGVDNDHNGYVDDISGWNFHRDTNDPQTDNSAYSHPDGESAQFVAEANNGLLGVGVCPNCRLLSIKAGDEAIDRPDRVAEAIAFAADSGAKVIDVTDASIAEAPVLAAAIDYAYQHGAVLVWASNDFESGRPYRRDALCARMAGQLDRVRSVASQRRQQPRRREGADLPLAVVADLLRAAQSVQRAERRRIDFDRHADARGRGCDGSQRRARRCAKR